MFPNNNLPGSNNQEEQQQNSNIFNNSTNKSLFGTYNPSGTQPQGNNTQQTGTFQMPANTNTTGGASSFGLGTNTFQPNLSQNNSQSFTGAGNSMVNPNILQNTGNMNNTNQLSNSFGFQGQQSPVNPLDNASNVQPNSSMGFTSTQAPSLNQQMNSSIEQSNLTAGIVGGLGNDSTFKPNDSKILEQSMLGEKEGSLLSSIKESTSCHYNMSVKEIVDTHIGKLNDNIEKFKAEAELILEQDMKLFTARNNYIAVQKAIDDEKRKMDDLKEGITFFKEELNKRINESSIEGDVTKFSAIQEFEEISDKFHKKVELLKDENDGVMDVLNENFDLIDRIDKKMDTLSNIINKTY